MIGPKQLNLCPRECIKRGECKFPPACFLKEPSTEEGKMWQGQAHIFAVKLMQIKEILPK